MKIYLAAMEALRKKKGRMKVNLPPKLVENLVWVPVISFCKNFILFTRLMPYYVKIGRSHPKSRDFTNNSIALKIFTTIVANLSH
jgi:hypothetical protein